MLKFAAGIEVLGLNHDQDRSKKRKHDKHRSDIFDKRPRLDKRESKLPLFRYNNYTSLNTARRNILIEI